MKATARVLASCLLAATFQSVFGASNSTADLSVYFEAGCYYCIQYFNTIIRPTYPALKTILNLKLYPWGNQQAFEWKGHDLDGFSCQHGIEECASNLFMACAVAEVEDYSKVIDLVMCMMGFSGNDKNFPTFQVSWTFCSDQAGVDEAAIKE
ncbi:gamma-interferon-inducible lysosomal thiol reductase-like [Symsagittifera roscoffensis]|uniref:gamma-interferon-inducible lysosomal thiol reductase-like n=1 Tax=Symsagittifera roscoffensis TaxID=84072 RepID=UPI00307C27C8